MLKDKELQQIINHNITVDDVNWQLNYLKKGFNFIDIFKSADLNSGILRFTNKQKNELLKIYDKFSENGNILKFIPASGAASRMFKDLLAFYNDNTVKIPDKNNYSVAYEFFVNIKKFAFYDKLNYLLKNDENLTVTECLSKNKYKLILDFLLTDKGLNYANLPKALIYFHKYKSEIRTSFEEHIVEGILYGKSNNNIVNLHFTISQNNLNDIKQIEKTLIKKYTSKVNVNISYSYQDKSTDTIAIDMDNKIFVKDNGEILFRPGGHGALINNLNKLQSDIIFIKNIDNVVVDNLKQDTVIYKKILAGYLLKIQNKIFNYIKQINNNSIDISDVEGFVNKYLQILFPDKYFNFSKDDKINFIKSKLNRPIRVCGMVKNQGEPGGGPFWVKHYDDSYQLQIIEKSQINIKNKEQEKIMKKAKYFNPVDLVISTKNFKGEYFNLNNFIDKKTNFISKKSFNGRELKAFELPGLWNGAMSDWNTIFVEVPLTTFNPVKIVNDLLRPVHIN